MSIQAHFSNMAGSAGRDERSTGNKRDTRGIKVKVKGLSSKTKVLTWTSDDMMS